jgi:hypothetical protein
MVSQAFNSQAGASRTIPFYVGFVADW